MDSYTSKIEAEFCCPFQLRNVEHADEDDDDNFNTDDVWLDSNDEPRHRECKQRSPNAYGYEFGNVYEANWYLKFLHPSVRERTYYLSSNDRFGEFRSLFRMPLKKIDDLVSLYIQNGWVHRTKHCKSDEEMIIDLELRIMGALKVLGHNAPFRTLKCNTNISDKEHRMFSTRFLHHIYSLRNDYIGYPKNEEELAKVVEPYEQSYLPGCGGSVDVVHVKWGHCHAGDVNRCKGKEGYPSLAFEVVTGFNRQILGVSHAHFGTRNDKHIVRSDPTINSVRTGWYRKVVWHWYDENGNEREDMGIYFICDGGYIRWPELICPYKHESVSSKKGYFSSKIESVRKDVECVFGILKKRWRCLDYGIRFKSMKKVEQVFTVCCVLHNMMSTEMETGDSDVRVGRGAPIPGDGIWLRGDDREFDDEGEVRALAVLWARRRDQLAEHIHYCAKMEKSTTIII